jgi:hypothetical protein
MEHGVDILKSLIPVFTLIVGSALTYFYGVKSKRTEAALKYKEEQYGKLIVKLQGFVGKTANAATQRDFLVELYKAWLYSSDEVIEAVNNLIVLLKESKGETPDLKNGHKVVGNIVIAMRKDLYGKTKLGYDSFMYIDVIG